MVYFNYDCFKYVSELKCQKFILTLTSSSGGTTTMSIILLSWNYYNHATVGARA